MSIGKISRASSACGGVLLLVAVVCLGASTPTQGAGPKLSLQWQGSNVVVNFSALLQSANQLEGPYTDLPGITPPLVWQMSTGSNQFWRSRMSREGVLSAGSAFSAALKTDGLFGLGARTNRDNWAREVRNTAMVCQGKSHSNSSLPVNRYQCGPL